MAGGPSTRGPERVSRYSRFSDGATGTHGVTTYCLFDGEEAMEVVTRTVTDW